MRFETVTVTTCPHCGASRVFDDPIDGSLSDIEWEEWHFILKKCLEAT